MTSAGSSCLDALMHPRAERVELHSFKQLVERTVGALLMSRPTTFPLVQKVPCNHALLPFGVEVCSHSSCRQTKPAFLCSWAAILSWWASEPIGTAVSLVESVLWNAGRRASPYAVPSSTRMTSPSAGRRDVVTMWPGVWAARGWRGLRARPCGPWRPRPCAWARMHF